MGCKKCEQNEDLKREIFEVTKPEEKTIIKWTIIAALTSLYGVFAIIRDIIGLFL